MTENPERVHCDERLPLREWSERMRKNGVTLERQAELLGYEDDRYFRRMREANDPNVVVIDNEIYRRKPRCKQF